MKALPGIRTVMCKREMTRVRLPSILLNTIQFVQLHQLLIKINLNHRILYFVGEAYVAF